VRGTED